MASLPSLELNCSTIGSLLVIGWFRSAESVRRASASSLLETESRMERICAAPFLTQPKHRLPDGISIQESSLRLLGGSSLYGASRGASFTRLFRRRRGTLEREYNPGNAR